MALCKRMIMIVLAVLITTLPFLQGVYAGPVSGQAIRVVLDGKEMRFEVPPVIRQGRTMVPMSSLFMALGARVTWESRSKTVTAVKGNTRIVLQIGSKYATVDSRRVVLDVCPFIQDGKTLVPAAFISQSLGASVKWDAAAYTVFITRPGGTTAASREFAFQGIHIGDSEEHVVTSLGEPGRKDISEYGFEWYVYNRDYTKYIQVGIRNGKVVGIYTNAAGWKSRRGIEAGSTRTQVEKAFGKPLAYIEKGNTRYSLQDPEERGAFLLEGSYVTVFYDIHNQHAVTAIQLIEKATELSLNGYYGKAGERLGSSYERQAFDLANAIRFREGKKPYAWDERAALTARTHSSDMAENGYFSHENLQGKNPFDRMGDNGLVYRQAAENIACGQPSAIFAHEAWMNSAGHRRNILGDCSKLGVGVSFGGTYKVYYTQNFYTPG